MCECGGYEDDEVDEEDASMGPNKKEKKKKL